VPKRLIALFALSIAGVAPLQAATFMPSIEESRWELVGSKFMCRMTQDIPAFGLAEFEHEAGEEVRFILRPTDHIHFRNGAYLVAEPAPWQPAMNASDIGFVKGDKETGFLHTNTRYAKNMLAALNRGMMPTFTTDQWYGTPESLRVALSAVNFQAAYPEYVSCVSGLLPVNFRQVARTAVLFTGGGWHLSDSSRKRLDLIKMYVDNDDSVNAIYVDGHSDSAGRRLANRDLSKKRAEAVTEYLVTKGMDESMITTRYHGERYPVVPNNSKDNRARNRRVTIRLERE